MPLFLCALCLGCGVAGQPHPPRVERPQPVRDLAMAQKGAALNLAFTPPRLAVDGLRLTKPVEFEIFRQITPFGEKPAALSNTPPWTTESPDEWAKHTSGDKVILAEPLSNSEYAQNIGATFSFAVRGVTYAFRHRRVESEPSNLAQVRLLAVSDPIDKLEIKTTEKALELTWAAAERSPSGQPLAPLAGYRVRRSDTGKPGSFELRGEPLHNFFSESDFVFGHTYFYKVCAWFKQDAATAESDDSETVKVTPRDVFPPAAPRGLAGIFSAGAVQLVWSANTEPDLAGYNVYRREGAGAWQKVNAGLLPTPTFEDRAVEIGHQYAYRITAVDLSNNESAASDEVLVEAR